MLSGTFATTKKGRAQIRSKSSCVVQKRRNVHHVVLWQVSDPLKIELRGSKSARTESGSIHTLRSCPVGAFSQKRDRKPLNLLRVQNVIWPPFRVYGFKMPSRGALRVYRFKWPRLCQDCGRAYLRGGTTKSRKK